MKKLLLLLCLSLPAFGQIINPTSGLPSNYSVVDANSLSGVNLTLSGLATFRGGMVVGNGLPADATVTDSSQVKWDATNHVLTLGGTACGTTAPCQGITRRVANTADGTGVGGCGAGGTAGAGKQCVFPLGGSGVAQLVDAAGANTEGDMMGPSTTVSGSLTDIGAFSLSPSSTMSGQLISTVAAGSGTVLLFPWSRGVEHVISFNLIKSGAIGVFPVVDFACTIYRVDVTADQSGTIALDIWKANAAIPAAGGKISGTTWTPLSGAQSAFSTTLAGWSSTAVASGDVFGGTVGTFTTVTNVLVQIRCH